MVSKKKSILILIIIIKQQQQQPNGTIQTIYKIKNKNKYFIRRLRRPNNIIK